MPNTIVSTVVIVQVICLAIFINWPAPQLSNNLRRWKRRGEFRDFMGWNVFYIDEKGNGPSGTVICLHGFPTSSYDWIKILPQMKQQFSQIVMLDFVGFGFSGKPTNHTYTIGEQADIVGHLAKTLGVQEAHILSHDYGDTVALELLARHNAGKQELKMLSLTMLNGGIFPDTHHPRPVQKLLLVPVLGYVASHLYSYPLFKRGFGEIFGENRPTDAEFEDFWAALRYNNGDRATYKVINFLRERQAYKLRWVGALTATDIKVLMIYGPVDPVNPPEFAGHFKRTVPKQTIVTLDASVGHYPQWEDPQTVGREFCNFVSKLPAPS